MNRAAIALAFLVGWVTGRASSSIGSSIIDFQVITDNLPTGGAVLTSTSSQQENVHHCECDRHDTESATTNDDKPISKSSLNPLEHSKHHHTFSFDTELRRRKTKNVTTVTDTMTPFHRYMMTFGQPTPVKIENLPQLNSWLHYFEAYHNHMARFRGQARVVFMEIGVQSGGKIPLLRKYFGPGLVYVGIDVNNSTKMFETDETDDFTVHIEIGDSSNVTFLQEIKEKYPHVDIFLDDGGHTMVQQITALKHMLPHVQPEGVYMCEDLGTSWLQQFGGVPKGHVLQKDFVTNTTVGFIHQTLDWFMAGANKGKGETETRMEALDSIHRRFGFDATQNWWKTIPSQVKHIHYYNQLVVYEKGVTYQGWAWKTIGRRLHYYYSGDHDKINWKDTMRQLDDIFGEGLL